MLSDNSVPKTKVLRKKSATSMIVHLDETEPVRPKLKFRTLAEEVAQSDFFYRNQMVEPLKRANPEYPRLWIVDQYFPHAEGGPLYVDTINRYWDEGVMKKQIEMHSLRAKIMRAAGFRYVFVTPGMTYEKAIEQMRAEE